LGPIKGKNYFGSLIRYKTDYRAF